MRSRPKRRRAAPSNVNGPRSDVREIRCYLCDRAVKRADEIVRVHEATMHRRCYEADIRRGR
jgi:hypothetical protein